jgi:hypothetical protein
VCAKTNLEGGVSDSRIDGVHIPGDYSTRANVSRQFPPMGGLAFHGSEQLKGRPIAFRGGRYGPLYSSSFDVSKIDCSVLPEGKVDAGQVPRLRWARTLMVG